jgi:hypothetical protein
MKLNGIPVIESEFQPAQGERIWLLSGIILLTPANGFSGCAG